MARLPLEPKIARMVLEAQKHSCIREVVTVAAFLSVNHIFVRSKEHQNEADSAHAQFKSTLSDALTFLKIWDEYESSEYSPSWCYENFLNGRTLFEIRKIREQLFSLLAREGKRLFISRARS
jgi:HrpA-like RNA helicase